MLTVAIVSIFPTFLSCSVIVDSLSSPDISHGFFARDLSYGNEWPTRVYQVPYSSVNIEKMNIYLYLSFHCFWREDIVESSQTFLMIPATSYTFIS